MGTVHESGRQYESPPVRTTGSRSRTYVQVINFTNPRMVFLARGINSHLLSTRTHPRSHPFRVKTEYLFQIQTFINSINDHPVELHPFYSSSK